MKPGLNVSKLLKNLDLQIDEQYRGDCPICAGYNTFTATRTVNGILFNCYKAGCQLAGRQASSIRVSDVRILNATIDTKPFRLPSHVLLGRPEITEWINKHAYPFAKIELYYDLHENRIVFPVRYDGKLVDATGRARNIGMKRLQKWKRYGSASYAYTVGSGPIAVVVEDAISAAVIGGTDNEYTGIALLGTALLSTHVEQLQAYTKILVALDPDAYPKTLGYTRELRGTLPDSKILAVKLGDDLKYERKNDMVLIEKLSQAF